MNNTETPYATILIAGLLLTALSCNITGGKEDEKCNPNTQDCEITDPVNPEPGWFGATAWHPDEEWIAAEHGVVFDTNDDGAPDSVARSGIWLVNATTGEVQDEPLLEWGHFPDWSPDGTQLVVHEGGHIYTLTVLSLDPPRIDTASIRQLTTEGRNFYPDWSPDGEWIAYDRSIEDETGPGGVWRMKQDGEEKEYIFGGAFPHWHPSGEQVIGAIGTSSTSVWKRFKIYTILDGSTKILDATVDADNRYPKYSVDGTQIAFVSAPPPPAPAVVSIWVMGADGNDPQKISPDWSGVFSWRPDGKQIVFLKYNPNEPDEGNGQLWLMDPDGTNVRQLTRFNPESLKK